MGKRSLAACSLLALALALGTSAARAQQCFPKCSPGFVCHQGTCISACNPLCAANEVCSPAGECVSLCNPACGADEICTPQAQCVSACNPPCAGSERCSAGSCVATTPAVPPVAATPPAPPPVAAGPMPPPPDAVAPSARSWQESRRGVHFGLGLGAVYLPMNDGITAGFITAHVNVGLGKDDFRTSAGFGTVSGSSGSEDWDATTLFLAPQYQLNISELFSIAIGPLIGLYAYDGSDSYTTLLLGPTGSPAIFRFGGSNQMEIGLTVFAARNFHEDDVTPGGYVAFNYLFL